jgi:hypothetical protein
MGAVQSALGVSGRGRKLLVLNTCSLQFAKAGSATTLPQQKKSNSVDVQRDDFIPEFESLADSFAAGAPPPTRV